MDMSSALGELEALAEKLDVQVVYDHLTGEGMGQGGLCKVKGRWRVIVERRCSPSERVSVLVQALSRFDLESHFLSPSLREFVDRYRPQKVCAETSAAAAPEPPPVEPPAEPVAPDPASD